MTLGIMLWFSGCQNQPSHQTNFSTSEKQVTAEQGMITWRYWSDSTFEYAKQEDKPVLLHLTNTWSHWCRVMESTTYTDPTITAFVQQNFIAVNVDSDRYPDVNRRYNMGGYPSTIFLTPTGEILAGGTYYPPTQMLRELQRIAQSYERDKDAIYDKIPEYRAKRTQMRRKFQSSFGNFDETVMEETFKLIRSEFDLVNGGFGDQPKFTQPYVLRFLLAYYDRTKNVQAIKMLRQTLDAMADGGIHDHLGGGFHRYCSGRDWILPEFEKLGRHNAQMLRVYGDAGELLHDERYRSVAEGVVRYLGMTLSRRNMPGFYSSQAADRNDRDNGEYYTWRRGEAAAVLLPEEMRAVELYFDIQNRGEMPDVPNRNVLYIASPYEEIAKTLNIDVQTVSQQVLSAATKLLDARLQREAPPVDSTLFVETNARLISAYQRAGDILERPDCTAFAQATLDFVLDAAFDEANGVRHTVLTSGNCTQIPQFTDHVYLLRAVLDVAQSTEGRERKRYLTIAKRIAEEMERRFRKTNYGGYVDIQPPQHAIGELRYPEKDMIDNAEAAMALVDLSRLSDDATYKLRAERALHAFGGRYLEAEQLNMTAAYALAVMYFLDGTN